MGGRSPSFGSRATKDVLTLSKDGPGTSRGGQRSLGGRTVEDPRTSVEDPQVSAEDVRSFGLRQE